MMERGCLELMERGKENEWREVRRRGVAYHNHESNPARHRYNPNPRNTKSWTRRGNSGNDSSRLGNRDPDESTVTFFFNNLPEDCSIDFLRRKFGTVRKPADVFCPRKRDLKGKPFGFVRFEGVNDPESLLVDLNKLWIGSFKIRVSKPRFERESKLEQPKEKVVSRAVPRKNGGGHGLHEAKRKSGVSFKEVLTGVKEGDLCADEVIQFKPMEEEMKWLEGAFTGFIKEEFLWEEIKNEINSECSGKLKVSSLGGSLILIRSTCESTTEMVLKEMDEWSSFWFQWKRKWQYVDVYQQRVTWTRWMGVPLHAWNSRFFDIASANFGMVLKLHEATKTKEKLDEAYIQISSGLKSVDRFMECSIDGACFHIRIEEVHDNSFIASESSSEQTETDSDSKSGWSSEEDSVLPADATIGGGESHIPADWDDSVSQEANLSIPDPKVTGGTDSKFSYDEEAAWTGSRKIANPIGLLGRDEPNIGSGLHLSQSPIPRQEVDENEAQTPAEDGPTILKNYSDQGNELCTVAETLFTQSNPVTTDQTELGEKSTRDREEMQAEEGAGTKTQTIDQNAQVRERKSSNREGESKRMGDSNTQERQVDAIQDQRRGKGKNCEQSFKNYKLKAQLTKRKKMLQSRGEERKRWGMFISNLESEEDNGADEDKERRVSTERADFENANKISSVGQEIWKFGKELGLSSVLPDEEMALQIEKQIEKHSQTKMGDNQGIYP